MARRLCIVFALALSATTFAAPVPWSASASEPECNDAEPVTVVVGQVACQKLTTDLLGPGIKAPFMYYVPPQCDPARGQRCPVLYLLHGFGGDYTDQVGTPGHASPWVESLTAGPPPGFESNPRAYADPVTWEGREAIGMILVAPRGRTLDGGYGPAPDLDSYWGDWNPRYAAGGDSQRYDTPPPRFESFLLDELLPFVEANFPTGSGREWRAIGGVSLGGYGSYKNGLQHPDVFTTMLSVSGAHNFLFAPGLDANGGEPSPVGIAAPIATPAQHLPGASGAVPRSALPSQASTFLVALDSLGDPVADEAFFRGNTPRDLALNALAFDAEGQQIVGLNMFWNNLVAEPQDAGGTPFEVLVTPMNVDMEAALVDVGVEHTTAIHPGNHSGVYRYAWYRGLLEFTYAQLQQSQTGPTTFNYRTISTDFGIWDWHFAVERDAIEFLTLTSVSCKSVTLQGTGVVTFTPPASCGLGKTFSVDLGPSMPVDETGNAGAVPAYGNRMTLTL